MGFRGMYRDMVAFGESASEMWNKLIAQYTHHVPFKKIIWF